jgi:WD40 repeat-containing protein SMU1
MIYVEKQEKLLTCSSDGTIKVFDTNTRECVHTFQPSPLLATAIAAQEGKTQGNSGFVSNSVYPILAMKPQPLNIGSYGVLTASSCFLLTDLQRTHTYFPLATEITNFCFSPKGKFVYLIDAQNVLHCFNTSTGSFVSAVKTHEKEVLGILHHPHRNLVLTWARDRRCKFWIP